MAWTVKFFNFDIAFAEISGKKSWRLATNVIPMVFIPGFSLLKFLINQFRLPSGHDLFGIFLSLYNGSK